MNAPPAAHALQRTAAAAARREGGEGDRGEEGGGGYRTRGLASGAARACQPASPRPPADRSTSKRELAREKPARSAPK